MIKHKIVQQGRLNTSQINELPRQTGVYIFVAHNEHILYVGKAKYLKERVKTYFSDRLLPRRLRRIQREAAVIRYILTATELDALLLEDDLIKKHRPPLNRMQKDYRRSVYVRLAEREPFVSLAIEKDKDALYYGPFKNPWRMKELIDLISDYVGFRPSILYGETVGRLSLPQKIQLVKMMFEGQDNSLHERLVRRRETQSRLMLFESAARTQEKIRTVEATRRWAKLLRAIRRPVSKEEIDKLHILSRYLSSI